jgi:hypothetical protein
VEAARARRALFLATGLLTVLSPAGLGQLPLPVPGGRAERPGRAASAHSVEPNSLELTAPDLLEIALRLELGPGYAGAAAWRTEEALDFTNSAEIPLHVASAATVAEPPRALLLLLMLASAAGACRERHRSRASSRRP